eukprot:450906_1
MATFMFSTPTYNFHPIPIHPSSFRTMLLFFSMMGSCFDDGAIGVSTNPIHVRNVDSSSSGGLFHASSNDGIVSICNTNFSYIEGVEITGGSDILLDNVEFYHVALAIRINKNSASQMVSDSYFHRCDQGIYL